MSIFWKLGNIIKIDKYWTSLPYVFFSSAVSMVIERLDFSENEYLNLKLYISTSVCQTFLRNFFLKLPLFNVQNTAHFFEIVPWNVFIALKSLLRSTCEKLHFELFLMLPLNGTKFWKLETPFCYHFSPISNKSLMVVKM